MEQKGYFVVHAPRQTGKTTTFRALAQALTAQGRYAALHVTCEEASIAGEDYGAAVRAILAAMRTFAEIDLPLELRPPPFPDDVDEGLFGSALRAWGRACPRPLVIVLDEIDSLIGQSLISVLRHLWEIVDKMKVPAPEPIKAAQVDEAKERLLLAHATQLDSLLARPTEPRVKRRVGSWDQDAKMAWPIYPTWTGGVGKSGCGQ